MYIICLEGPQALKRLEYPSSFVGKKTNQKTLVSDSFGLRLGFGVFCQAFLSSLFEMILKRPVFDGDSPDSLTTHRQMTGDWKIADSNLLWPVNFLGV